ncbi:restriction endonuclease subunit M [Levilactobacillus brevis]|uniref:HsdM family class I SAM-dependent methyltransferase n=1 Tax=Levilactobacillus brevis TaxID=1580 RepID=UPI000FF7B96D|nr:N-6 DNA methylase [Levilactobacillus brevis]RWZ41964.1 restriction endonuclease subunit M [Levilactobacillus brevis]
MAANATGTTRDEMILEQLSMIIITKLYDEKYAETEYVKFRVIDEDPRKTSKNIKSIFSEAKERWNDVFLDEDKIDFNDSIIMSVVGQLQNYSLIESPRNVISEAFESIIAYATKGSQGQFFTPENVAKLMVRIANPNENTSVFDPASGTAGFLTTSMFYVWEQIDDTSMRSRAKYDKEQQFATNNLFGIEKDSFLAKISKAFMAVLGDGRAGIFIEDSLNEKQWKPATIAKVKDKKFDIILTNPPFGKDVKVAPETKSNFKFADKIELAFVEKCMEHLKVGGTLGVILPETIFHAPTMKKVREELFYKHNITHIIDLPHDTFRPYNNAKTDIIFLQKNKPQQDMVTVIKVNEIGHDHLGHEKFILDNNNYSFTNIIADDIPNIIDSLNSDEDNPLIKKISIDTIKKRDLLVARPYFEFNQSKNIVSLEDLINKGVITTFDGHGSPAGYLKGLGENPYVRVKDIVNLEIAHNRLDDIPDKEYDRLYKKSKKLKDKDIVFVRRGSYRIGDVGILYKKDLHSILTREILIIRVNENNLGITPFNLLAILNSEDVRKQLGNLILMDTTLPNIGDRWKSIKIDVSDPEILANLTNIMKKMYDIRAKFWDDYSKVFGMNG